MGQVKEGELVLHPEFGVNPSKGVCFWCGKEDGRVLLLGLNGGQEAAPRTIAGYEPCGGCAERFAEGVLLIEARRGEPYFERQQPMDAERDVYPSGATAVVSDDEARTLFNDEMATAAIEGRRVFVDAAGWKILTGVKDGTAQEGA